MEAQPQETDVDTTAEQSHHAGMQKWSWALLLTGYACGSVGVTLSQPLQGSYSASTGSNATGGTGSTGGTDTGGTSTTGGGLGTTNTGGTSGGGGASSGGSSGSSCTADTWTNYIQSVFINNCDSCHNSEFLTYAGVVADTGIQSQVSSNAMPLGFTLQADTKTRLLTWITCGMPQ